MRITKAAGNCTGRQRRLDDDQVAAARADIVAGIPKSAVARELGIDRTTLYRALALPQPDELTRTEIYSGVRRPIAF
ncbi:helix-turn-helix domain-containing protein [Rathayibacter sp. VKM Ac-2858]|uniref:helix-turn-helix domain-containing protein n=1 Tax=unclassified Rathayibacter TaxID=2609250 RepID=UPI00349FA113